MKCRIYGTKNIKEWIGLYTRDLKMLLGYNFKAYQYFKLDDVNNLFKDIDKNSKIDYVGITDCIEETKIIEITMTDIQSLEGLTHIKIKNKDYSIKSVSYNTENNIYEIYTSYEENEYVNDYDKAKEIYDKIFDTLFEMRKEERLEKEKIKQKNEELKETTNENKLKNWFKRLLNK